MFIIIPLGVAPVDSPPRIGEAREQPKHTDAEAETTTQPLRIDQEHDSDNRDD
jgi:hypothetical protein